MYQTYKELKLKEWDNVRENVMAGIRRIGHDIPITGYGFNDNIELGKRKAAGVSVK